MSIGVPWMLCALCARMCTHTMCIARVCTCVGHTHLGAVSVMLPPFLCLVQLHITKLLVEETCLKGRWSTWVVVWVFTPTFLSLIRQASPPHLSSFCGGWRVCKKLDLKIALSVSWACAYAHKVVWMSQSSCEIRCPRVDTSCPKWVWLNSSF